MKAALLFLLLSGLGIYVAKASSTEMKLGAIRIPSIEFSEVPIEDAIEFFQIRSAELDITEADPAKKGINILAQDGLDSAPPISMTLRDVSLGEALAYMAQYAGLKVSADAHAVILSKAQEGEARAIPANRPSRILSQKLSSIVIPSLEFSDVPFDDALEFLRVKSQELDTVDPSPGSKGVNLIRMPPAPGSAIPTISIKLRNIPLGQAVKYVSSLARYEPRVLNDTIILYPKE